MSIGNFPLRLAMQGGNREYKPEELDPDRGCLKMVIMLRVDTILVQEGS